MPIKKIGLEGTDIKNIFAKYEVTDEKIINAVTEVILENNQVMLEQFKANSKNIANMVYEEANKSRANTGYKKNPFKH